MKHHGEALRAVSKDEALVEALSRDPRTAPLDARMRALVEYALKLTLAPADVRESDIAPLRAVGLSDPGIHDAAAVVAYFNFVNRLADGLGVEIEEDEQDSD